jgi:cation diffusion facilitator CzcD-associated flavoprotein CzcO
LVQIDEPLDLIIIGGGIGGIVCLYYAKRAGLNALLLERQDVVGGLWARLPEWQDIQSPAKEWTLGDLPIDGEDQKSILKNIQAWVDRFELAPRIVLGEPVERAEADGTGWSVATPARTYRSRYLVSATGGHNRPVVPAVVRSHSPIEEYHSSALRDPSVLSGKDVLVVGGGASAYDLLELCLKHQARRIAWVYRTTRWMRPTQKPKNIAGDTRALARMQMLGNSAEGISRHITQDFRERYEKYGLQEILPDEDFDLRRHQLIPGRREMIAHFREFEKHRGEVAGIEGRSVHLTSGARIDVDLILWGTGYEMDLGYFASPALAKIRRVEDLARRCGALVRSLDEPNLFFLAVLLDVSVGSMTWSYAHAARTIVSHICGQAHLDTVPVQGKIPHFELAVFLAERDPYNYPPDVWRSQYEKLALEYPQNDPLPIP